MEGGNYDRDWAFSRERPSLRIRNCSVERFIPNRVAAPLGPATTQFVCDNTLKICFRSVSSRTFRISLPAEDSGFLSRIPLPLMALTAGRDWISLGGACKTGAAERITARSITF